jgi:choline dehydrogenase-like flavoprotein
MRTAALAMGGYLADRGIGRLQLADWLREEDGAAPPRVDVLHHHMCTTRMSADPREGVVDADGRVHEATNLSLAGSGTFATAGQANPTYTVVQLALRQADRLAAALTRGGF